jgi:hypothetical protein
LSDLEATHHTLTRALEALDARAAFVTLADLEEVTALDLEEPNDATL